ncbi:beta-propeller fold lactonase family protein [Pseudoalteromonas luteoviolacea]|uniref:beta-propeller fold lactonase family protein n=1 Tax=Pseudoalteromonas luteoviolacea TaxID=43657 RepID=UPI0007B085C4|nr:beta-propeller fold lactonase family protein [Pseudoalteromonas luteoviolacea]
MYKVKHILLNNQNGISGIANPRDIVLSEDHEKIFVASGDNDALTILNADNLMNLPFSQSFSEKSFPDLKLKGASSVVYSPKHNTVYTTSFYSGSLTSFATKGKSEFYPISTLSDNIDFKTAFGDYTKIKQQDSLGLIGAWSAILSNDENYILTASYQSDAISRFQIDPDGKLSFKGKLLPEHNWGRPTSIEKTKDGQTLFVAGFENNQISVLKKAANQEYQLKQILSHPTLLGPQKLVTSSTGQFLFAAGAKSNSLVVFKKGSLGNYLHHQSIDSQQLPSGGLNGACCIALTKNENAVYVSGEMDNGLLVFDINQHTQQLTFNRKVESVGGVDISKVSVLRVADSGKYLFIGTGKNNTIVVLQIKSAL